MTKDQKQTLLEQCLFEARESPTFELEELIEALEMDLEDDGKRSDDICMRMFASMFRHYD